MVSSIRILLVTVFIMLWWLELVPLWLTAAVVARDAAIVLEALLFVTVVVSGIDYILIYGRRGFGTAQPRSARAPTCAGDRP